MKRLFALLSLVLCLSLNLSVVANATEVVTDGSEIGDSPGVVDTFDDLDTMESGEDNGGESSTASGSGYNSGSGTDEVETFVTYSEPSDSVSEPCECVDVYELIELVEQSNELLRASYIADLFVIGTVVAVFVLVLLYKFLKLFF